MSEQKSIHPTLAFDDSYRIHDVERVLTPALAIYSDVVDANIATTLRLLGGDAQRWRPHVKTTKLAAVMRRLVEAAVTNFKCATTFELLVACEVGATDVLVAYPVVGAHARRVGELARRFPATRISVLVENADQVQAWVGSNVGLFIDVNPGMDRTGIDQARTGDIVRLARSMAETSLAFRGLHYYDGHLSGFALAEREIVAHRGYDRLMEIVAALETAGLAVPEVITAGTPAFPGTLSYARFARASFLHRASPGTVVYGDCSSLAQLPPEYGYRPAALVVSTVVSYPTAHIITCDAGHKTVSADAGVPTCAVLGRPDLRPMKPSEEHLPIEVPANSAVPSIGAVLYLLPRHICPTVNNFDYAMLVRNGHVIAVERVTARGHETPLMNAPGA